MIDKDLPSGAHWYLQAFDRETDFFIAQYKIVGITGAGLEELLDLDDSDYPIEYAQHHIENTDLPKIAPYLVDASVIDASLNYDVAVVADQSPPTTQS